MGRKKVAFLVTAAVIVMDGFLIKCNHLLMTSGCMCSDQGIGNEDVLIDQLEIGQSRGDLKI